MTLTEHSPAIRRATSARRRRVVGLAAGWLAGVLALSCAPGETRPYYEVGLVQAGTLTVCVAPLGPPAAALPRNPDGAAGDKLVGYNVDFAREIANRLELPPSVIETPFVELLDAVAEHRCDLSVSSQNITTGRLAIVDFVPYTRARQRVLVAKDNPQAIDTIEGLCGQLVSATDGSILVDMVEGTGDFDGFGLSQACLASGRGPIEVHRFPDHEQAVQALLDGSVAAHLGNSNYVFRYPERLDQSPATLPAARQGIGVAKDRQALRSAVSGALIDMLDDGTYHAILLAHLGSEDSVRAGSIDAPAESPAFER